ncbi:MAG: GNAT family N-acetyltransferase [Thermoplasmata archaeon]|nr:GNAT family N-acetyltransferase [Thermoplasmata archaeon]
MPDELRQYIFRDPDYDPAACVLLLADGCPVGYGGVMVERMRIAAGKDDAILDLEIIPGARDGSTEERLVQWGLDVIKSKAIGTTRLRIEASNAWKLGVAKTFGFEERYRIFDLARHGSAPLPEIASVPGIRLERQMLKDCSDDEVIWMNDLLNETFVDHFNSVPNPPDRFMNMRDASRDEYMVGIAMGTDGPVGISLTELSSEFNRQTGKKSGWIVMLGVVPRRRGAGIGRLLLADGMNWLLEKGMDSLNISLIAKNEKAMSLYTSLGFRKDQEAIWHERPTS